MRQFFAPQPTLQWLKASFRRAIAYTEFSLRRSIGFLVSICVAAAVLWLLRPDAARARGRWTELNIGPFYADTDGESGAARDALTQLEQVRWVLGGLLESKDLPSVWPIRVVLSNAAKAEANASAGQFVWRDGEYILGAAPGSRLPLDEAAGILLDANTPRLPPEVESGLRQLFGTLEAKGSRVSWGGAPAHPDLAWARMQLFATKFQYSADFHIFIATVRTGSPLRPAEQNAFGKNIDVLEREAAANLAAGNWQSVPVSGRPLDPKRDLGEHSVEAPLAELYLADAGLVSGPEGAKAAYQSAVQAGGMASALGYERLAALAKVSGGDPKPLLEDAIRANSRSAPVYVSEAEFKPADEALPLLKEAAQLNPLWADPVFRQAQLISDPAEKETLLKKAVQLDPRNTEYWIELAQLQGDRGEATASQGTWLRAENSAPTDAERERVHGLRVNSEQERLNASENAQRKAREAVHLEDEQAQQAETDRIRAAEQAANAAKDGAAGTEKPETVVPWTDVVPRKKLNGSLLQVDCLGSDGRLLIRDKAGDTVQLLLKDPSAAGLSCGAQKPARRVSLTYAAQADERFKTAGTVVTIAVQ